jgi:RNA polymerase I-specific transcription initiation factor RRN3
MGPTVFFSRQDGPHSKFSQFNHRVTKAGPQSRNIESIPPSLSPNDSFKMPSRKPSIFTKAVIRRPLATNSRVKQDEIFKRDMYLSYKLMYQIPSSKRPMCVVYIDILLLHMTNPSNLYDLSDSFDELMGQFSKFSSKSNTNNIQLSQADGPPFT